MTQEEFFNAVKKERETQILVWGSEEDQYSRHGLERYDSYKLAVLGEEFGEVCQAFHDEAYSDDLSDELIQLAAVAQAWSEKL